METVREFIWGGGSKSLQMVTAAMNQKMLAPWKESTGSILKKNLGSIFKSRDITLPTKVRLVKAMVYPVVMY